MLNAAIFDLGATLILNLMKQYNTVHPERKVGTGFEKELPLILSAADAVKQLAQAIQTPENGGWEEDDPRWEPLKAEAKDQLQKAIDRLTE